MQTPKSPEDDLVHLAVCVERASSCHQVLQDVKADLTHPLAAPAFRHAIVEYMTMFNQSKDSQGNSRRIFAACVPANHVALHERLKKTRNELLAHADMSVLAGALEFTTNRTIPTVILTHQDDMAEFKHIDEFLDLVQCVRNHLFAEYRRLSVILPSRLP